MAGKGQGGDFFAHTNAIMKYYCGTEGRIAEKKMACHVYTSDAADE
jgi:hypothetical protein